LLQGQIYESNGVMLAAHPICRARWPRCSASCRRCRSVSPRVGRPTESADLIVTSGGGERGAYEVVKDAFTGNGVEFRKVAMQPGMPRAPAVPGRAGGDAAGKSGQRPGVVRGVPAPGAAFGHGAHGDQRPTRTAGSTRGSLAARPPQFRPACTTRPPHVRLVGGPGSHLLRALAWPTA